MTGWTPDRLTRLRQLVAEGATAGEIAGVMGVSRDAVIGKCAREGLRLVGSSEARREAGALRRGQPKGFRTPGLRIGQGRTTWDDAVFTERWADRKARLAAERGA